MQRKSYYELLMKIPFNLQYGRLPVNWVFREQDTQSIHASGISVSAEQRKKIERRNDVFRITHPRVAYTHAEQIDSPMLQCERLNAARLLCTHRAEEGATLSRWIKEKNHTEKGSVLFFIWHMGDKCWPKNAGTYIEIDWSSIFSFGCCCWNYHYYSIPIFILSACNLIWRN